MKQALNPYMQTAIEEARRGIAAGDGGPFGSVVVRDGIVIGRGHNRVLGHHDPTAHGEVEAIRDACVRIKSHDLTGCEIYTTGEPCHMCLCACLWANISHIYYGCTIKDNSMIGFRDDHFNDLFAGRDKMGDYMKEMDREACLELFEEYRQKPHDNY